VRGLRAEGAWSLSRYLLLLCLLCLLLLLLLLLCLICLLLLLLLQLTPPWKIPCIVACTCCLCVKASIPGEVLQHFS
jgi:uncharacterized membrane protein YqjE